MGDFVNVDNFVRAETARMFDGTLAHSGGVNRWMHLREPVPLDRQTVIRMNRDTLYSAAIVDIGAGARITVPDAGGRYVSVMVVNQDHHVNRVLHDAGAHDLTTDEFDTPFVSLNLRVFVDPDDPADVAAVNELQDAFEIAAAGARPYTHRDYDAASLDATRAALLTLSEGLPDARDTFGPRDRVDPVRHLIGTAYGWGGLPEDEAFYVVKSGAQAPRHHRLVLRDVPVDEFWSMTVYNRDGYLEPNPFDAFSLNSVTAKPDEDGAVTIDLDTADRGYANHLYVMDGWNYALRFYRPRAELLDGTWTPPAPEPVSG